jgi:hypothetical protein
VPVEEPSTASTAEVNRFTPIATHLPDEHFIIRVDGRVKSHHRRFLDALREGLQLRDQFPQLDVKVRAVQVSGELSTDSIR